MAGDWIKMRCDLYRDPKVILMADELSRPGGDLAAFVSQNMQRDMAVTRNVTRNAVIGGLLSVWGIIRKQGRRENDDLLLKGCGLSVLDDIADMPGFGDAMDMVGWVRESDECLVFPRFFEDNNSDKVVILKAQAAERQRKFREKTKAAGGANSNANSNVTVTLHNATEKSRVEKSIITLTSNNKAKGTLDDLKSFCLEIGMLESDGESMYHHWEANGWKNGSSPSKDWRAGIRKWKSQGWLPSQKAKPAHRKNEYPQENLELPD